MALARMPPPGFPSKKTSQKDDPKKDEKKSPVLNASALEFTPRSKSGSELPHESKSSIMRELDIRRRALIQRRIFAERELAMRAFYDYHDMYDRRGMYHPRLRHDDVEESSYGDMYYGDDRRSQKKAMKSQGRGFKSKQKKITQVYNRLVEKFSKTEFLQTEVTRSYETSRVHAKTWHGLDCIEKALDRICEDDRIKLKEIGFHKSMKNKYQQKGILVYIRVETDEQVKILFNIYNSYDGHLKDHAVAISKEERENVDSQSTDQKVTKIGQHLCTTGEAIGPTRLD